MQQKDGHLTYIESETYSSSLRHKGSYLLHLLASFLFHTDQNE
jgi:hypothetical protein